MNKKGFTLTELLATIALLAIISLISLYSIGKVRNNIDKNLLKDKIDNIEAAAVYYGEDNRSELTTCNDYSEYDYCKLLTVNDLLTSGYLESDAKDEAFINNLSGYSMKCDTVLVFIEKNRVYSKMIDINSESNECNTGGE